ncbi:DUF3549 family protein [Pistricoccus aurantiacus]|uniref:DUF3549 family protein n=1 Tax=Pistricoccus aurantiacus TaxID=1883414 RepID=A0A5B8SWJ7_9GAMM|nr:DUF3549 family protein [Pistricoccus aurantiacus]QEA40474.1 DUF3549 family protein [Pistricoccus aurantiacus]
MRSISTIHDFFMRAGAELNLYHTGRRVAPCPISTLEAFENQQLAWPMPWQGQARLACVFTLGDMPDPIIWFLALPLDEQGYLTPAPRDAFLQRLLETLGHTVEALQSSNATAKDMNQADNLMKDNPLAFTPSLHHRAMLHAQASRDLERSASEHLELVESYLLDGDLQHWQALGLQGLADFVARLDTAQATQLAARLPALPIAVLHPLCYCLEQRVLIEVLTEALRRRGEQAAREGDLETLCACIRSVGASPQDSVSRWYTELLEDANVCGPDVLAALAARGWEHLEDATRLPRFLERAAADERVDFTALVRDLAAIPRLRLPILMLLREAPPASDIKHRLFESCAKDTL